MIKGRDTKPEIILRHNLHVRGFRYRKNVRYLPGKPDVVLAKYRTVIFVNGCFWHGHKDCRYATRPKTNAEFWHTKIENNRERDLRDYTFLESLGWHIIVVWECELKSKVFKDTIARVEAELAANKVKWESYQARRRSDREFARAEARRKRQIREEVERELQEQFNIPVKIRRMASADNDE